MHEISGSRIVITGGAGFVGSFIAEQILEQGAGEVVLLDNFVRGSHRNIEGIIDNRAVKLVEGDIRDTALLKEVFLSADYCFHMAALRITHCAAEPDEAFGVMFQGCFNVINACIEAQVKKSVFASSASIYGLADEFPTSEGHHAYNNVTLYGAGKLANEAMLRSFHHLKQLDYCAMRYFNVYGPRMDTHGKYTEVLIRWYNLIKEGKQPLIFGDGQQTMDFVFIEEIARANVLALKSASTDEVFNVGSGVETTLEELCFALIEAMGAGVEPKYVPLPEERSSVEVTRRLADVSKARDLLGFESQVSLKQGMQKLVAWLDVVMAA